MITIFHLKTNVGFDIGIKMGIEEALAAFNKGNYEAVADVDSESLQYAFAATCKIGWHIMQPFSVDVIDPDKLHRASWFGDLFFDDTRKVMSLLKEDGFQHQKSLGI